MRAPSRVPRAAILAALVLPGSAFASGFDLDIEMLRPGVSSGTVVSESARLAPHTLLAEVVAQIEHDPLLLLFSGEEVGVVVGERQSAWFELGYDVGTHLGVRAALPVYVQWGSEVIGWSEDGTGLGDPALGVRIGLIQGTFHHDAGYGALTLREDLLLPNGRPQAWMGEGGFRNTPGLLAAIGWRRVELLADVSGMLRGERDVQEALDVSDELRASASLRYAVWPERAQIFAAVLLRRPLDLATAPRALSSTEALAGLQIAPSPGASTPLRFEAGLGRGLSGGYGTAEFRVFAGATWFVPVKRSRSVSPGGEVLLLPSRESRITLTPEPEEVDWAPEQLARVRQDRIEIHDPIQFVFATAEILPTSFPTVSAVASILGENSNITLVVIEGHASEEGSFSYNYDLSVRRARAIYERLVQAGVHPRRLGVRGMGEVEPSFEGRDEATLAANRRVVFHIVEQLDPLDPVPDLGPRLVPWSGQAAAPTPPPNPAGSASPGGPRPEEPAR